MICSGRGRPCFHERAPIRLTLISAALTDTPHLRQRARQPGAWPFITLRLCTRRLVGQTLTWPT